MRHAGQLELVVEDAEHGIALEVDRVDVFHQRRFADDVLEAQAQVFRLQRQKVAAQRLAVGLGELQDGTVFVARIFTCLRCARPGAIQA
jgi:hypothetical protein